MYLFVYFIIYLFIIGDLLFTLCLLFYWVISWITDNSNSVKTTEVYLSLNVALRVIYLQDLSLAHCSPFLASRITS